MGRGMRERQSNKQLARDQYSIYRDSFLTATVSEVFGWPLGQRAHFTMIRSEPEGRTIDLVFGAERELRVQIHESGDQLMLDWSSTSPRPDDVGAARVGHALETFLIEAGFIAPDDDPTH